MNRQLPIVTIDGPAGAGKSTITLRVARSLGYLLLGTGSLYRAVALAARQANVSWDDEAGVGAVAWDLARSGRLRIVQGEGGERVLLDDVDVSAALRAQEMGQGASCVSAMAEVRAALLDLQRDVARGGGVVVEGRDVGTVVFPDAEAKFFLTASAEVRAQRRTEELRAKGESADFQAVLAEVQERDRRDTERAVAPLRQADDALLVDSSHLTIDQVVELIVNQVQVVAAGLARS